MAQTRDELRAAIDKLFFEGAEILSLEFGGGERKKPAKKTPPKKANDSTVPTDASFNRSYQLWYSKALRVIEQLLPDRYAEFRALYSIDRKGKIPDVSTYAIFDYLQRIRVTSNFGTQLVFEPREVVAEKFYQQVVIVESAKIRLDSILSDIKGVIEASLFDSELDAARDLVKAKHVRAAGIVAGVVLERHLKHVIENHKISFRKTSTLSNLNQALKDADVIDVTRWRRLQYLTDIRNLCGHSGTREPSAEEAQELIKGVNEIIRTVF